MASPPPFDPRQFYPIKIEQAPDNPFLMGIDCKVSCGGAPVPMVAGIEAEAINGRLGQVTAHLWLDDLDVWVEAEPVGGGGPVERAHLVTRHGFVVSLAREDGTEILASRDGLKFRLSALGIATVEYRPAEERS